MDFLPEEIEDYILAHSEEESQLLQDLHRETWQKVLIPRMLSGHLQGRVLSMLSHMNAPEYILEIGTYTGYSALCLAEGMQENGELHTIDRNEELVYIQNKYFEKSPRSESIKPHLGDAMKIVPDLKKPWDLVFVDADKDNYINYYEMIVPLLRKGAVIIFDNVLWSGKVVEQVSEKDKETKALVELNKQIQEDDRVQNVLFPIRDGLMIVRKK